MIHERSPSLGTRTPVCFLGRPPSMEWLTFCPSSGVPSPRIDPTLTLLIRDSVIKHNFAAGIQGMIRFVMDKDPDRIQRSSRLWIAHFVNWLATRSALWYMRRECLFMSSSPPPLPFLAPVTILLPSTQSCRGGWVPLWQLLFLTGWLYG